MSSFFVVISCMASPIPTPALLTSTSSRPKRSRCDSTRATICSSSVIIAGTECTSIPAERKPSAALSSFSGRRAETVTS